MTNSTGVQHPNGCEAAPGREVGQPSSDGRDHADLLKSELHRIANQFRQMGARKIILFGSYARGRADALTDLDLVVVMDSELPFVERTAEVYRRIVPRVAADILVYTPGEWERMQDRPFGQQVLREGRVLYEKTGRRGRPPLARSGQRGPEVGPAAGR
ncbi:MAG: nucleotidyltransferase domain-containing protein [Bacillota bacterium]|nr:nucleotidyltransferase domain-containing protein [Bacillota bacterium]